MHLATSSDADLTLGPINHADGSPLPLHLRQTRPPSIHPSIVPVPVQILYQQGAERGVNVYNCVRSTLCT